MSNCQNPTIAIVDSGIGGVSVLRQLIEKYNAGNYIYYADNLYMPYGNKNQKWLKSRMDTIINELQNNYKVDYIIIACNTASANIEAEKYRNVIIMSFENNLNYFATKLTQKSLKGKNVIADRTLAKLIENNIFHNQKLNIIIKKHIEKHGLNKLNSFVLGCTHYELVKTIFEKYCPNTKIINNSYFVLNEINFVNLQKELNVVVMLSKQNEKLKEKILMLINS